jgi:hypothetical protein
MGKWTRNPAYWLPKLNEKELETLLELMMMLVFLLTSLKQRGYETGKLREIPISMHLGFLLEFEWGSDLLSLMLLL